MRDYSVSFQALCKDISFTHDGVALSKIDTARYVDVLILHSLLTVDILYMYCGYKRPDAFQVVKKQMKLFINMDVLEYCKYLGDISDEIRHEQIHLCKYDDEPVYYVLSRNDCSKINYVFCINQWCNFPLRASLTELKHLEQGVADDYVAFEKDLQQKVKNYPMDILEDLRRKASQLMMGWDWSLQPVLPSNGATREVNRESSCLLNKFSAASQSSCSRYFAEEFGLVSPMYEFAKMQRDNAKRRPLIKREKDNRKILRRFVKNSAFVNQQDFYVKKQLKNAMLFTESENTGFGRRGANIAKFTVVPKSLKKLRAVSTESTEYNHFQLALRKMLLKNLERDKDIWHIDLSHQARNQYYAQLGSANGEWVTTDLSSASDSSTVTFFNYIFQDTPLPDMVNACRSKYVDLKKYGYKRPIRIEKLAGMGSGFCFVISNCMIFSLIVQLAIDRVKGHDRRLSQRWHQDLWRGHGDTRSYYNFCVYGDDIICRQEIYEELCKLLSALFYTVNLDKSFDSSTRFKESCGIECYAGCDISPLRIPRTYDPCREKGSEDLSSLVDFTNSAYDYNYQVLHRYLVRKVKASYPNVGFCDKEAAPLYRFDENHSRANHARFLYTTHPENHKCRWNKDLQIREYLVEVPKTSKQFITSEMLDVYDLYQNLDRETYDTVAYIAWQVLHVSSEEQEGDQECWPGSEIYELGKPGRLQVLPNAGSLPTDHRWVPEYILMS